jgi:hypothetical protein
MIIRAEIEKLGALHVVEPAIFACAAYPAAAAGPAAVVVRGMDAEDAFRS